MSRDGLQPRAPAEAAPLLNPSAAIREAAATRVVGEPSARVVTPSDPPMFFLRRLRRLAALNRYCTEELPTDDPELHLLRHAIYSTFRDCIELGVTDEARLILERYRVASTSRRPADQPVP